MQMARDILKKVILVRFDSIDHKLTFLLQEIVSRSDTLCQKNDDALWTLSEKLDKYFSMVTQVEGSLRLAIDEQRHQLSACITQLGMVAGGVAQLQLQSRDGAASAQATERNLANAFDLQKACIDDATSRIKAHIPERAHWKPYAKRPRFGSASLQWRVTTKPFERRLSPL